MVILKRFISNLSSIAKELDRLRPARTLNKGADLNPGLPPIDPTTVQVEAKAVDPEIFILYKKSLIGKQILAHRTEGSVLDNPEGTILYELAGRKRISTCSGVSWFADRHLAVVNLYGQHLRIYRLEEGEKKVQLQLLHHFTNGIHYPEDVAVSPDCSLIGVTHTLAPQKGVTLHRLDKESYEPMEAFERLLPEYTCHGIEFSPDSRYLAFTTIDGPCSVEVYNVTNFPLQHICSLSTNNPLLRPKDVCFTGDSKYVAIIYSRALAPTFIERTLMGKRLAIHRFDSNTGVIEKESVATLDNDSFLLFSFELAAFIPEIDAVGYRLFIANQAYDKVVEIVFNPDQCSLMVSGSHQSNLSFPHGIDVTSDNKLIAVTNLGDDSLHFFELDRASKDSDNDTRTHILLCGHSASPYLFGAERSLIDLAVALSNLGYKVSCLLPHENIEYTNELAKHVYAVFYLAFDWITHTRPYSERHVNQIEALIHRESIDIVHSNSMVVPNVLIAARRSGIRGILHARELLSGDNEIAACFGQRLEETLKILSKDAEFIIANSKSTQQQFLQYKETYCLYNAVDLNRFNLPVISAEGVLKVGMISSNTFKKGLRDFVELACAAHMDTLLAFYLIGPKTPDVEKIELELQDYPSPVKIQFLDYVADPVNAIAMIDVVVNLSTVSESFGRTVAEAMAARRPVIVYDRGAMSELVIHRETGFIVPPGDILKVLEWLRWLVTNRTSAGTMGDAGRHVVENTFSFELFQKYLKVIYEKILAN